jgi:hypothetical protein
MLNTLNSFGLTTAILQLIIFGSVVAFLFGLFHKEILIGTVICFCLYVCLKPSTAETQPVATVEQTVVDDTPKEFIQDCLRLAGKTEAECKDMWKQNDNR